VSFWFCGSRLYLDSLSCREEAEVDEWVQVLKQRYAGMKLLVGRDKLDEIQVGLEVSLPLTTAHVSHRVCATKSKPLSSSSTNTLNGRVR